MILPLGLSTLPPNKTGVLMARKNELMAGHPKLVATATYWQWSLWKISKPPSFSRLSWLPAWGAGTEMPSGYRMAFSQVSLCCSQVVTHTKIGREWSISKIALLYPPLTSFLTQRAPSTWLVLLSLWRLDPGPGVGVGNRYLCLHDSAFSGRRLSISLNIISETAVCYATWKN